jgi:uncharacterized protein YqgC (DUF456 family)
MDISILIWLLAVLLIVAGVAGLALPMLPGAPLLFGGLVVAAWAEDFAHIGTGGIVTLGILALLTYAVDIVAGILGAKKFGASRQGIIGSAIGTVVGLFFGLVGIILGPFAGAVVGELFAKKQFYEAGFAGLGTMIGMVIGAAAKLALAFTMIGVFAFLRLV